MKLRDWLHYNPLDLDTDYWLCIEQYMSKTECKDRKNICDLMFYQKLDLNTIQSKLSGNIVNLVKEIREFLNFYLINRGWEKEITEYEIGVEIAKDENDKKNYIDQFKNDFSSKAYKNGVLFVKANYNWNYYFYNDFNELKNDTLVKNDEELIKELNEPDNSRNPHKILQLYLAKTK